MDEFIPYILIVLFIGLMMVALRWDGQKNPVGTGKLTDDVAKIRTRQTSMETKVTHIEREMTGFATKGDLKAIGKKIADGPSAAAVARLEAKTDGLHREMDLMSKSADRTEEAVVRIERWLMDNK